jgi:hypothetical protein
MDEAHIQHPVCLIQHKIPDMLQMDIALVHQIEQPARRRHQDVHAFLQGQYL